MVHRRRQIGEFHEILEILDRRVAPLAIEVAHEGRAVDRREHRCVAADLDAALRVARMLREYGRRGFQELAAKSLREVDALALDVGAGLLPQLQGFLVVAKLDADFLQHRVGIGFDRDKGLLVEDLVDRNPARDIGHRGASLAAASRRAPRRRAACRAPSGASACAFGAFCTLCTRFH